MNNTGDKRSSETSANNVRRKFLVRGAATALIASIPVKTSWASGSGQSGCMVSGTLSGNQSAVCNTSQVNGWSPKKWKNASDHNPLKNELKGISWDDVFAQVSDKNYSDNSKNNLHKLLRKGSDRDKNLIAGYLNALKHKYPLAVDVTAVQYARMLESEAFKNQSALINALEQTYTEG